MSCPNLFIPDVAWNFYEEHLYLEKHPHTAPPFHEVRPRFRAFEKYFTSCLQEFRDAKATGTNGPVPGVN